MAIGVVLVLGIVAYATRDDAPDSRQERAGAGVLGPGDRLPDLELRTLDGGRTRLSDFLGRPLVVNFWASWCNPCRREFPILADTLAHHEADDLAVVGITFRDIESDSRAFADDEHASWPLAVDGEGDAARAFGVRAIPVTFFVDADGVIAARVFGFSSASALDEPLAEILR